MAGQCLRLGGLPTVDKADSHPSPPAGSTRGRRSARPSRSPGRRLRRQGHQRGDEADQGRKAGHPAVLPRRGFQGRPGRSRAEADRTARDTSGADGNIKTASAALTADECRTVEAHLDQIITSADRTNNIKAVNGSKNAKDPKPRPCRRPGANRRLHRGRYSGGGNRGPPVADPHPATHLLQVAMAALMAAAPLHPIMSSHKRTTIWRIIMHASCILISLQIAETQNDNGPDRTGSSVRRTVHFCCLRTLSPLGRLCMYLSLEVWGLRIR